MHFMKSYQFIRIYKFNFNDKIIEDRIRFVKAYILL